jgi:ElaB/YqjD/DUF883 family membrane-anchored ribosome-binding protein
MQGSTHGVRENAAATVNRVSDSAHETVDRLADTASTAMEQWGVKAEELLAMKDRAMDTTRTYVRENPLVALGIALAVGILLARITR